MTPKLFLSYSHHDEYWKNQLVSHLRPLERAGDLEIWDTSSIEGGSDWATKITETLKETDIALLLVSPDFLASDFIVQRELPFLLQRKRREDVAILPIVVRPTAWSVIPDLAQLHFLNTDAKPLALISQLDRDAVFANIVSQIEKIAGALKKRRTAPTADDRVVQRPFSPTQQGKQTGPFFVSHSNFDGDFAELLQLRVEKDGFSAWIDRDRLAPGVDWREEIDEAIRKAPALIAVMSPEARQSEYVTYEWAFAWGCKKKVIPLMLRQTPLHPRLATLQFLDFSNRESRPWQKLLNAMSEATKIKQPN